MKAAITDMAVQWVLFLIAAYFKTEKFYDLAGSSTFLLLIVQSLLSTRKLFPRQVIPPLPCWDTNCYYKALKESLYTCTTSKKKTAAKN